MNVRAMLLAVVGVSLLAARPSSACQTIVSWQATLTAGSPASHGVARFTFSADHPQATLTVTPSGLNGITRIELHASSPSGSPVIASYAPSGTTTGPLVWAVRPDELRPSAAAHLQSMGDFLNAICDGRITVRVCTKAHPTGAASGTVKMSMVRVYSAVEDGRGHDPSLHAAAHLAGHSART